MKQLYWAKGSRFFSEEIEKEFGKLGILIRDIGIQDPNVVYYGCCGEAVGIAWGTSDEAKVIMACGIEVASFGMSEVTSKGEDHDEGQWMTLERQFANTFNQTLALLQEARKAEFFPVILTDGELQFVKYDHITNIGRIFDKEKDAHHSVICTNDHFTFETDEPVHDIIMRMAEWCEMREKQE